MTALAHWFMLAHGWRRAAGLMAAGALASLSLPPFFVLPVLLISFPIWIWSLDGAEAGQGWRRFFGAGFAIGFWFGLGYFAIALTWLGAAFFVDGGAMLLLMPFAVLGLSAGLAVFWAAASAGAHLFWGNGPYRIVIFAGFLSAAEFLRGHLFTGFPFSLPGYALTANEQMMQAASVIGIYGLTLVAIMIAVTPALIWPAEKRPLTRRLVPFFLALGVLGVQLGYGQYRLAEAKLTPLADARLRLVQPNIAQDVKWRSGNGNFILERLLTLSQGAGPDQGGQSRGGANPASGNMAVKTVGAGKTGLAGIDAVIWPESAFPFYLSAHPDALARIARMLPDATLLVTGAPYLDPADKTQTTAYNSVLALDHEGTIVSSYAKTHLVPFGEYLPFGDVLKRFGLRQFVAGDEGWTAGDKRRLMSPPGLAPFLPLICYEADFSGDLNPGGKRAGFMLNVTNDAWFAGTAGPAKLFHYARLRAVEEGMSLVRVANSGISALVDPMGRISAYMGEGEMGVLDVNPMQPLAPTLFVRLRYWPFLFALAAIGAVALFGLRRARRREALGY